MAHHRYYPSITNGSNQNSSSDVFAELIESTGASFQGGAVWSAEIEKFSLFDSPTEELTRLVPRETDWRLIIDRSEWFGMAAKAWKLSTHKKPKNKGGE